MSLMVTCTEQSNDSPVRGGEGVPQLTFFLFVLHRILVLDDSIVILVAEAVAGG